MTPKRSPVLARVIHDQRIMRAILMTCFDKPVYARKHPDLVFQIWSCLESEYVEVYLGFGGLSLQSYGLWRIIRARPPLVWVGMAPSPVAAARNGCRASNVEESARGLKLEGALGGRRSSTLSVRTPKHPLAQAAPSQGTSSSHRQWRPQGVPLMAFKNRRSAVTIGQPLLGARGRCRLW